MSTTGSVQCAGKDIQWRRVERKLFGGEGRNDGTEDFKLLRRTK